MRHKIARKVNEITERPIIELNMSMEEKMKDFEYLYNCIATSLPLDTLFGIEKQYGIDFVERHDLYKEMIADYEYKKTKKKKNPCREYHISNFCA